MPSSNSPSDLNDVIVCALDAAYINATDENSNGCLNRSFADIKELPRLLFQCVTLATPRWVGKQRHSWGKCGFLFSNLNALIFKGASMRR